MNCNECTFSATVAAWVSIPNRDFDELQCQISFSPPSSEVSIPNRDFDELQSKQLKGDIAWLKEVSIPNRDFDELQFM